MRNFQKIKELSDWNTLDAPVKVPELVPFEAPSDQMILRMLVRTKYGRFEVPQELAYLEPVIYNLAAVDASWTGIRDSWCYVTVRSGIPFPTTDEWHFDGGSLRTELIPERNYVWCDRFPLQYKMGNVNFPEDFDPLKHNMFTFAAKEVEDSPILNVDAEKWYLLSPFCLHRRDPASNGFQRTFIRVSFIDIEVRDVKCTQNPLLPTEAYERNPVKSFRDSLVDYPGV